jgi:hypothetical protein
MKVIESISIRAIGMLHDMAVNNEIIMVTWLGLKVAEVNNLHLSCEGKVFRKQVRSDIVFLLYYVSETIVNPLLRGQM